MKTILLIIIPVALLSYFLAGGVNSPFPQKVPNPSGEARIVLIPSPSGAGKQLQLNTFKFASPTPVPPTPVPSLQPQPSASACSVDSGTSCGNASSCAYYYVTCSGNRCASVVNGTFGTHGTLNCNAIDHLPYECSPRTGWTGVPAAGIGWCNAPCLNPTGNATSCMAKPVIYLYPEVDTLVNVSLDIPGQVTVSIPTYEAAGWQNVLARPGGNLEYRNHTYNELFYESSVTQVNPPENGIIIPKQELYQNLSEILAKLGLNQSEKKEFLDYWIPSLSALPGDYILFSILDPVEKQRVDKVNISPEPDTRIEILAYFKPLYWPMIMPPLKLPENPPLRKGFTMVEWGGTIDE